MVAIVSLRLVYLRMHRLAPEPYDPSRWLRIWMIGTGITGALWGLAGVVLFPQSSVTHQDLLLFVIGGMVAGASASMASFRRAFFAFTLPALLPSIGRLLVEADRTHWAMALLLAIFAAAMSIISQMAGSRMIEAVRLRLRNGLLVEELVSAREDLTRLNRELDQRVSVRTLELKRALSDRDQFVAIISHELRSPLSSLRLSHDLMARLLKEGQVVPEEARQVLMRSGRPLERMGRLVDDLLDANRLATDKLSYERGPASLSAILADTVEQVASERSEGDLGLTLDVPEELVGHWDRQRIEQVFTNLLSNAVKHGAPPFSITARRANGSVTIVVRDQGPGIAPEDVERILRPFERGKSPHAPGLGLGLYIAARIIEAHQGTMRVESELGKGAAFIVELPIEEPGPEDG
jgi:signal transduction histidine kinase